MVCLFDPGDYDRNSCEGSARIFPTDGSRIPIDMNLLPLYSRFSSCLMFWMCEKVYPTSANHTHVACEAYGKLNRSSKPASLVGKEGF